MADELTPEMLQEAQPDLLTLEDEDGKECTFIRKIPKAWTKRPN